MRNGLKPHPPPASRQLCNGEKGADKQMGARSLSVEGLLCARDRASYRRLSLPEKFRLTRPWRLRRGGCAAG
jgi:hypothetical protein